MTKPIKDMTELEHKQHISEIMRRYYQRNKEACNARSKAWHQAHKEEMREYMKAYRGDGLAAKNYYEEHKEELKAKKKAYYQAHKEEIKAKARARYAANKLKNVKQG